METYNTPPEMAVDNDGEFFRQYFAQLGKAHLLPVFEKHKDTLMAFLQITPAGFARLIDQPAAPRPSFADEAALLEYLMPYVETAGYILQSVALMTEEQLAAFWQLLDKAIGNLETT